MNNSNLFSNFFTDHLKFCDVYVGRAHRKLRRKLTFLAYNYNLAGSPFHIFVVCFVYNVVQRSAPNSERLKFIFFGKL